MGTKMHKNLILPLLISILFPMLASCDAEQNSTAKEVATDPSAPIATENKSEQDNYQETIEANGKANRAVTGKYFNERHPDSYIELNADGTFVNLHKVAKNDRTISLNGTYKVEGNQLMLTQGARRNMVMQLEDDVIINSDGSRWLKK
jgi:hypothetical protein